MIGFKEATTCAVTTMVGNIRHPSALLSESLSPRTQLALQVAIELGFPQAKERSPEIYRLLSNLIYYANNFFDIGLFAQKQMFRNNPSTFTMLDAVYDKTQKEMLRTASELIKYRPESIKTVDDYINDGTRLFINREDLPGITYREIDSGISAVLVFGVMGGCGCLQSLGINPSKTCTTKELIAKYKLFQTSSVNPTDVTNCDPKVKAVIGLQAIEMILACLDDQWGQSEDDILCLPNCRKDPINLTILINHYKEVAKSSGFSSIIIYIIEKLTYFHKLKVGRLTDKNPIELHEIQRYHNFGKIFLLREWLNNHSLLNEMAR